MRFVIQVKVKNPISWATGMALKRRGLDISKNQIITGLAEDFDGITEFLKSETAPFMEVFSTYNEINDAIKAGDYEWL